MCARCWNYSFPIRTEQTLWHRGVGDDDGNTFSSSRSLPASGGPTLNFGQDFDNIQRQRSFGSNGFDCVRNNPVGKEPSALTPARISLLQILSTIDCEGLCDRKVARVCTPLWLVFGLGFVGISQNILHSCCISVRQNP